MHLIYFNSPNSNLNVKYAQNWHLVYFLCTGEHHNDNLSDGKSFDRYFPGNQAVKMNEICFGYDFTPNSLSDWWIKSGALIWLAENAIESSAIN